MKVPVPRMNGHVLGAIAFAGVFALSLITGVIGLDFGFHWDEQHHQKNVIASLKSGILLPLGEYNYNYPSMTHVLSLIAQVPTAVSGLGADAAKGGMEDWLTLQRFVGNTRPLFLGISCLGGLWLYLALRRTHSVGALVAAAVYLTGWEFAYHARWVAPDVVLAQFIALWLLALVSAERTPHAKTWLRAAAAAAGLAATTKYPGGATLFATLAILWLRPRGTPGSLKATARETLLLVAIFAAAFLLVTPGALLQPWEFLGDLQFEARHYSTGHSVNFGVRPYDITEGWLRYLACLGEYVSLALFSRSPVISCMLLALALLGFTVFWRESGRMAAVLIGLVLAYSAFFSAHVVFIARSFLLLLPIFALMAGIGSQFLVSPRRPAWLRASALAVLLVALGWNGVDRWITASSIPKLRTPEALLARTQDYIADHPGTKILLAPRLHAGLARPGHALPISAAGANAAANVFLFRYSDVQNPDATLREWPATRAQTFGSLGPFEVNFNYYPTWAGRDRLFVMSLDRARRMGLIEFFARGAPAG